MMGLAAFFGFRKRSYSPTDAEHWRQLGITRQTLSGVNVDHQTALNFSAAWASTRLLSGSGSMLSLNLHRRDGRERQIVDDHPLQCIVHMAPNDDMGSMMFRSRGINHQVNWGTAFAEIITEGGGPVALGDPVAALEPIHPGRIQEVDRDDQGTLFFKVRPDTSKLRRGSSRSTRDIPDERMLRIPSIISDDGIMGKGVIRHARETLGLALATEQHGAAYFGNGARPSAVMIGGQFEDDEEQARYRRMWAEIHGGPENHHRLAMLPPDASLELLTYPPNDSQFLETRRTNVEEIARWYGVPPHMIQHLLRATFSNIEHQSIEFVQSLCLWLKIWEEEMWRKLLTPIEQRDHFFKHNVNALLRGDVKTRMAFYKAMFSIAVLSINEIRELEDLNPIENGDTYFVSANNLAPLDSVVAGQPAEFNANTPPPDSIPEGAVADILDFMEISSRANEEQAEKSAAVHFDIRKDLRSTVGRLESRLAKLECNTAQAWFVDVCRKMIGKMSKDIRRRAKPIYEGDLSMAEWLPDYFSHFSSALEAALTGPAAGLAIDVQDFVAEFTTRCEREIWDAADGPRDGFVARINQVSETWERNASATAVTALRVTQECAA